MADPSEESTSNEGSGGEGGTSAAPGLPPRIEPFFRPLRVYAFDPSRGSGAGNHMTIQVPYEKLAPGPVGRRIAVIDYDSARNRFYRPIQPEDLEDGGLEPSDSDPRFHQQMAYAVVAHTLRTFERALGRPVKFRFERYPGKDPRPWLRVFPHGMREANAYYSRELRALLFGYFGASSDEAGIGIPGQPVFTCLSHDILVHETCHAVIDGMREYFLEPLNRDTLAFHEAFADLVALFQHFTFPEPLLETIRRTRGLLYRERLSAELESDVLGEESGAGAVEPNPLVDLAREFGESLGTRKALRSAIGRTPSKKELEVTVEPHDRGAILVAAVFEAFFRVYVRRTRDLFRMVGISPGESRELHPDLAQRLCSEATAVAKQFLQLCIRSIEFCPPVDHRFGDFLRAMVTVHRRLDPDDPDGCRDALIRAFARRGIYPPDVRSLSESELLWRPPPSLLELPASLMKELKAGRREEAGMRSIAVQLNEFCKKNGPALGLEPELKVAVRSWHEMRLLGGEAEHTQEIVIELLQSVEEPIAQGLPGIMLRGGTTMVVGNEGRVRYAIAKQLHAGRRKAQLEDAAEIRYPPAARYLGPTESESGAASLQALHRGY